MDRDLNKNQALNDCYYNIKKLISHAAMLKDNNFITCRNDYY